MKVIMIPIVKVGCVRRNSLRMEPFMLTGMRDDMSESTKLKKGE